MALAGGCMSMLTLRQVPLRFSSPRRFDWPSPARVPRSWLTGLFAASAAYALVMALVTSNPLHRTWGIFAACSYLLAAMVVLAFKARGVDPALLISLAGALVLPLGLMAAARLQQPEVRVINKSASLLVHHGTPYLGPAALAAAHSPNIFDPYLPLMTLFGVPRALLGFSVLTDPRIWFGLALLWREPHPVLAGLALGVACAMKATAWPALLVAVVLVLVRDGRRAAWILFGTAVAGFAAIVGAVAVLGPCRQVQRTLSVRRGENRINSQSVSPLPGPRLVHTGETG